MNSIFRISKIGTTGIQVDGLESDNGEYITPEGIWVSTRDYTYLHSVTINTLTAIAADGTETFKEFKVVDHITNPLDTNIFTLSKDGLYGISHFILPNQTWLAYILETEATALENYSNVYYFNTTDNKIYKYTSGVSSEIKIEELLLADYADPTVTTLGTTIIRGDKNTFIMYYLNTCFNNACKNLLTQIPKNCINDDIKQQIFYRDTLWMAINVIKYCLDISQLYEAQRYLESITWCNSLNCTTTTNNLSNCGCN